MGAPRLQNGMRVSQGSDGGDRAALGTSPGAQPTRWHGRDFQKSTGRSRPCDAGRPQARPRGVSCAPFRPSTIRHATPLAPCIPQSVRKTHERRSEGWAAGGKRAITTQAGIERRTRHRTTTRGNATGQSRRQQADGCVLGPAWQNQRRQRRTQSQEPSEMDGIPNSHAASQANERRLR